MARTKMKGRAVRLSAVCIKASSTVRPENKIIKLPRSDREYLWTRGQNAFLISCAFQQVRSCVWNTFGKLGVRNSS